MERHESDREEFVVLGGGPAGLFAALRAVQLGAEVTLFEKESILGGLAAGHRRGGNWYDLGVHMLHAFDPAVLAHCASAMGDERIEVPLDARIKWRGRLFHYPLRARDMLRGIPPWRLAACVAGLMAAGLRSRFGKGAPTEDAESALIGLYGRPLYRFFFEDFTERYWGIHPRGLAAEFVRRKMPRLSAADVLRNALEWAGLARMADTTEGALRFETLHYSRSGAETLPRSLGAELERKGARIVANAPVVRVLHEGGLLKEIHTEAGVVALAGGCCVSTIPLGDFIRALEPAAPAGVLAAAEQLRHKPMVVYGLLVRKPQCMGALYTYYRDRVFHRVGEPKNAGLRVEPPDHTVLIVECTCEAGDELWTGGALPAILADLEREGLCRAEEVVEHHILRAPHAYPVFALGFEPSLAMVRDYLETFANLRSTGRQGAFTYPNMHAAMRMGWDAAESLLLRG